MWKRFNKNKRIKIPFKISGLFTHSLYDYYNYGNISHINAGVATGTREMEGKGERKGKSHFLQRLRVLIVDQIKKIGSSFTHSLSASVCVHFRLV